MRGELPSPDPFEPEGTPPPDLEISMPTAVFLWGRPSRPSSRIADAILAARPGLLIVALEG